MRVPTLSGIDGETEGTTGSYRTAGFEPVVRRFAHRLLKPESLKAGKPENSCSQTFRLSSFQTFKLEDYRGTPMRSQRTLLSSSAAVILGATAVLVPAPARAQEIKAGFSTSTISFSPEGGSPELPNVEGRTGFVVGVSFLIATSKPGGYQIEVLLHQKGAQNLLRRDDRLRLTYLEIPVLLHIDLVQRGRRAIFLVGGPAPAFNVHGSYEDDGVTEDVTRDIEDFDIGLVAGGGVEVRYLTVDARYTWGLRSAFHDGELEGAFKNRAFTLMVGFRFGP
jgi:Outer membrane protein beta-barrel domain